MNGNGNGDTVMANGDSSFLRLERSLDAQEKQFQATRDDVNALKGQQVIIQRDLGTLNLSIQGLSQKMDERAKPNIAALTLGVTLAIAIVPVIWFIVSVYTSNTVSPVSNAVGVLAENLHHVNDTIRTLEINQSTETIDRKSNAAATKVALAEIETQLRALCNNENLRAAQQERMNSMIYEQAFTGKRYPNGTFFSPCIAHDGRQD